MPERVAQNMGMDRVEITIYRPMVSIPKTDSRCGNNGAGKKKKNQATGPREKTAAE